MLEAVLASKDILEAIRPDQETDEWAMNLAELAEYTQRIVGILEQAEYVRLCRIADMISEYQKK